MNVRLKPANADEIEMSLEVTMTLAAWKKLAAQVREGAHSASYPSWRLLDEIRDLVRQAETHFEIKEAPSD